MWVFFCADNWRSRWLNSKHKSDYGEWKLTAGNFYGDAEKDKGKRLFIIKQESRALIKNISLELIMLCSLWLKAF